MILLGLSLPGGLTAAERFHDVTEAVGLGGLAKSGVSWMDFNADGWPDLFAGGRLWLNRSGRRFEQAGEWNCSEGGVWSDMDGNGRLDLFCWSDGLLHRDPAVPSRSSRERLLPAPPDFVSRSAAWGDYDGDGRLDLYVGGYEEWTLQRKFRDTLFLGRPQGGLKQGWREPDGDVRHVRGVVPADFDSDGDMDLFVCAYRLQTNRLWINEGKGEFYDGTRERGIPASADSTLRGHSIGAAWGDLDSDGDLDLVVANLSHPYEDQDPVQFLENLGPEGRFHFRNRTREVALRWQESYASPALADFDNDGRLDLFLTTVYPGDRGVLYRNLGDWRFQDVTEQSGIVSSHTYQAAWADFDNDGDPDLVTAGRLYRNDWAEERNQWLKIRLRGCAGIDSEAVGAQVRILMGERTLTRQVESVTGESNQNEKTLHFGLGQIEGSLQVQIQWPEGGNSKIEVRPNTLLITRCREP